MRLPEADQSIEEKLTEFGIWLTPNIFFPNEAVEVKKEVDGVAKILDTVLRVPSPAGESPDSLRADHLASIVNNTLSRMDDPPAKREFLERLASALFMATGKSDNSFKAQFPVFLKHQLRWSCLPKVSKAGHVKPANIGNVLTSKTYLKLVANLNDRQKRYQLLRAFFDFILDTPEYRRQLWSLSHSFQQAKSVALHEALLRPLAIYKLRGSLTASLGHWPEARLRDLLKEWGLEPGIDYNLTDVDLIKDPSIREKLSAQEKKLKTRAFDFILPYKTPGWPDGWQKRLFIQGQFYGGDSGSVSHKNLDQDNNTKSLINKLFRGAVFVEYVDGAGYASSLKGDLRRLLENELSRDFFQVKTAPLRLRRRLQRLGFLVPLEIEHAILLTKGRKEDVLKLLIEQGYQELEINRALERGLSSSLFKEQDGQLFMKEDRVKTAQDYALLDIIAAYGQQPRPEDYEDGSHFYLVPGYQTVYGLGEEAIYALVKSRFPNIWRNSADISTDISEGLKRLLQRGFVRTLRDLPPPLGRQYISVC